MNAEPNALELNNYKVLLKEDGSLCLLGKGGYGTTYKAEHKHLGRICALKVINDDLMSNSKIRQRFLQEAKAAAALNHPNIAIVHDFGESDGVFYYAMEFCSGGDLEEFSKSRGPQPWSVVRDLALQILAALREAHGKGLLHRDLKPSNVMLAANDGSVTLKLIDFGLVKVLDHHDSSETNLMLTQEGSFMGNPLTASPEQLQEGHLDERSDLFSLGVTLWYLLLGGSPFGGISTAQLVHQRLGTDEYIDMLPADLDESGRYILGKLLSKNRENRFNSAEETFLAIEQDVAAVSSEKITSKSAVVGVSGTKGSENDPVETEAPKKISDWSEIWTIREQLHKFNYGTYYACEGIVPGIPRTTLFLPNHESGDFTSVCNSADKLVRAKTQLLSGFYQKGLMDNQPAYTCPPFSVGSFQCLLQVEEHLSLQNHLVLFQQIAMAVDESTHLQIPGVELEITEVILGLSDRTEALPKSEDEWLAYFRQKKDLSENYVNRLEFTLLPKLNDFISADEAMVTLGDDDLAATPLARFGGLVYRSISGMAVKQTAYMSPTAHVSTSHLSEKANLYLSEVIADLDKPASAMEFLEQLCQIEGVRWSSDAIAATQLAKDAEKAAISKSYASMGMSIADLSPAASAAPKPRATIQQVSTSASISQSTPSASTTVADSSRATPPPQFTPPDLPTHSVSKDSGILPTSATQPTPITNTQHPQGKKSKKKLIIISSALVACLLFSGIGFGVYQYLKKDKKTRISGLSSRGGYNDPDHGVVDHGEEALIKVVFAHISLSKAELPDDAVIALCDKSGQQVASLKIQDGHGSSPDFPRSLFADASKWPITVKLIASGYKMQPAIMELSNFKKIDGGGEEFTQTLKLQPQAYLEFVPIVKFNGKVLTGYTKLMRNYLHPTDPALDWKLSNQDGKLAVLLPPDQKFPIQVILTVPHMDDLSSTLKSSESPEWDFQLKQRNVRLLGLGNFNTLKFSPHFDQISNTSIRETIRTSMEVYSIQANQLENNAGTWSLPEIDGTLEVTTQNGRWTANLSESAKCMVFTKEDKSEDDREVSNAKFKKQKATAESGDVDAQFELGLLYYNGEEVQKNEVASTAWFRVAAEQGDKGAQYNLGIAYEKGTGVEADEREALKWFIKAAKQNDPGAQMNLGLYYQLGKGVKKDYKKAEEWFSKAVAQGYAPAMFNLAVLYGDPQAEMLNPEKVMSLYQKAAKLGNLGALFNLAWHYENGKGGLEKNIPKAIELYRKAAEKNYPHAKDAIKSLGGSLEE